MNVCAKPTSFVASGAIAIFAATHCFVAATVLPDPRHPLSRLVGDYLVLEASASGRGRDRRIPFEAERGLVIGGTHHIALLNHPAVYEKLVAWLR